jgi:ribosomal protein S7
MRSGKKGLVQTEVERAFVLLKAKEKDPLIAFSSAIKKVAPPLKLVQRKQGSKSLLVPRPLTDRQSQRQAMLWIIAETKTTKSDNTLGERIAKSILTILDGSSQIFHKKLQLMKSCLANRSNIILVDKKIFRRR